MDDKDLEKASEDFLELSSEQRLRIMFSLLEKKSNISKMAKEIDATNPEVHRNFNRLLKTGLILKEPDGNYSLTTFGKVTCNMIPSFEFIAKNRKFFETHNFGDLGIKFIHRLGELEDKKQIKGFVKVIEKWKEVHKNSKKYIYNILSEVPYDTDTVNAVEEKLKKKIKIKTIFSEDAVIPDERKKIFEKKNFAKYVKEEILERKMIKKVSLSIVLNEKESCVIFPKMDGTPDMEQMFYSKNSDFHEWCLDLFNDTWNKASSFQEAKLAK